MTKLDALNQRNAHPIFAINDPRFARYGRVVQLPNPDKYLAALSGTVMPDEGTYYTPEEPRLQAAMADDVALEMGFMPVEVGHCSGHNVSAGTMEYHKSSELNLCRQDMILVLASLLDMKDGAISTDQFEAFLLPAGVCVEMYATTLHYAPVATCAEGFQCIVVLPRGTNTPLAEGEAVAPLYMRNKWLFAHEGDDALRAKGCAMGVRGAEWVFTF